MKKTILALATLIITSCSHTPTKLPISFNTVGDHQNTIETLAETFQEKIKHPIKRGDLNNDGKQEYFFKAGDNTTYIGIENENESMTWTIYNK